MTPAAPASQRIRRARLARALADTRAARDATAAPVLRMSEPPLPETLAYVRAKYGAGVVVVVEP